MLLAGALPAGAQPHKPRSSPTMSATQTETFLLSARPCAAKGYPMTIHFGAFIRSDGNTFPVPSGHFLQGNWGQSGISWSVGDNKQPAPDSLEILYFSYTENTFYEGRFALPQQRLYELLKTGFYDTDDKRHATYTELTVCVLPKGVVVIWLSGGGKQVLVGRFQGNVSDAEFKQFYPKTDRAQMLREERAKLPPEVQQQLAAGTISAKHWDTYLKPYSWQVAFSQPLVLYNYYLTGENAEITNYPDTRDMAPFLRALLTPHTWCVPAKLGLYVRDEAGHRYCLRVRAFDETQTQAAFQALHQASPTHPLTLRVETDKYLKKATLVLTDGTKTIPLTKSPVAITAEE